MLVKEMQNQEQTVCRTAGFFTIIYFCIYYYEYYYSYSHHYYHFYYYHYYCYHYCYYFLLFISKHQPNSDSEKKRNGRFGVKVTSDFNKIDCYYYHCFYYCYWYYYYCYCCYYLMAELFFFCLRCILCYILVCIFIS